MDKSKELIGRELINKLLANIFSSLEANWKIPETRRCLMQILDAIDDWEESKEDVYES